MVSDNHIFEKVYARLDAELPSYLTYHNRHHTEYVVRMADFLALKEGCSLAERRLIAFAALFHDAGFLFGPEKHEEYGCEIARQELQRFGLSAKDNDQICGMIIATKIPQRPNNLLEKIVADADLFYLGTDLYTIFSDKLLQEIKHFNPALSDSDWQKIQVDFISAHHYHSNYAQSELEPVKRLHLRALHTTHER